MDFFKAFDKLAIIHFHINKSITSKRSNAGLQGSSPTDSETHQVLVTCYNTWTGSI